MVTEATRFTHEEGLFESPVFSPDGTLVAYSSNREGNFEIYVKRVDGGEEVNVSRDPHEDIQPAFSPDGREIAFVSTRSTGRTLARIGGTFGIEYRVLGGGDLWVAPVLGGRARRVAQDASYPTFSPDGRSILYVNGPEDRRRLLLVPVEGGTPREVLASESSRWEIVHPTYVPGGKWIAFEEATGRLLVMPASGGTPRDIAETTGHAWHGSDLYLLQRAQTGGNRIEKVAFDSDRGTLAKERQLVWVTPASVSAPAISADGQRFAFSTLEASFNVARLPLSPDGGRPSGPEEVLTEGTARERNSSWSPKGDMIAFGSDRAGPAEIWTLDLATRAQRQVPLPADDLGTYFPVFTPDGNHFLVTRFKVGGPRSVWLLSLDGSETRQIVTAAETEGYPASPDVSVAHHERIAAMPLRREKDRQIHILDIVSGALKKLTTTPGDKYDCSFSPDDQRLAFVSNVTGTLQAYVMPLKGGEEKRLTDGRDRIRHLSWSPDGRWIYYQPNHGNVWRVPAAGGTPEQVTHFQEAGLFLEEPTVSTDGHWLAYSKWRGGASLWLVKLEAAAR
jgi:Tol biopolymer transport system component